ncbi:MAG: hypothetical protein KTR20_02715 [Cellvibrionaceae bacterium]|nr:hypothetical protein [Cellvibrionaceae bacterium]
MQVVQQLLSGPLDTLLAGVMFFLMFTWWLWVVVGVVLTETTPKSLLNKYFKPPHFNEGELLFMVRYPWKFYRTVIFGWGICILSLDRKRKIKNIAAYVPRWYLIAMKTFIVGSMTHGGLAVLLMLGLSLENYIAGN